MNHSMQAHPHPTTSAGLNSFCIFFVDSVMWHRERKRCNSSLKSDFVNLWWPRFVPDLCCSLSYAILILYLTQWLWVETRNCPFTVYLILAEEVIVIFTFLCIRVLQTLKSTNRMESVNKKPWCWHSYNWSSTGTRNYPSILSSHLQLLSQKQVHKFQMQ